MDKRTLVQCISTFVTNSHLSGFLNGRIYQGQTKAACVPVLNCYSCPGAIGACPIGAFQSSLSGVVPRISFYVIGLLLLFGIVLGRVICGWLCPFGWLQELLYKLPGHKFSKNSLTKVLCFFKYVVALVFVILLPLLLFYVNGIGEPAFCEYICPAGTAEAAIPLLLLTPDLAGAAGWLTLFKFMILGIVVIMAIVVFRPFCRFLCPLGAFYGFFNRYALLGIAVSKNSCTKCGACTHFCKMDIRIAGDKECIACGECVPVCPTKAIYFRQIKFFKSTSEVK